MNSNVTISQADGRPMYLQLMEQIRLHISSGDWSPGYELPSIRQLAAELSISVITVKRAYQELEHEGVIVTQQGRGSRVAQTPHLVTDLLERELELLLTQLIVTAQRLNLSEQALWQRFHDSWALSSAPVPDMQKDIP